VVRMMLAAPSARARQYRVPIAAGEGTRTLDPNLGKA
jgi:hypothetical protein